MIKKTLFYLLMLSIAVLVIGRPYSVDADSTDYSSKYIRVGLEKTIGTKSTMNLIGNGFTVALENEGASKLFDISGDTVMVKSKNFTHHVELTEQFTTYDSAFEKAKNIIGLGENAYVFYKNGFKVAVGEFLNETSALQSKDKLCNMGLDSVVSKNDTVISFGTKEGKTIVAFDNNERLVIKSQSETTKVSGKEFRGFLIFSPNKSNFTLINFIKLDDYLRGVVPREMSGSWHIEALKAQAVSARNYTLRNLNKHKNSGFDICDSTHCQVYEGFDKEHANSNKAIDETRNRLLKYNDEIAQTFYSSSSGGYTSSNENIWGGSAIPYLRGKKDPYSVGAPNSDWTYTISKSEASLKLKASGLDVGEISSFEFKKDEFGARVIDLTVKGSRGTKVVSKEKIRSIFGTSNIKSTNYTILGYDSTPVPKPPEVLPVPEKPIPKPPASIEAYILGKDSLHNSNLGEKSVITADGIRKFDKSLDSMVLSSEVETALKDSIDKKAKAVISPTITFKGSGWGHGVGMSQYGALAMAKEGLSYTDILEFYYTGTRVE